MSLIYICKEKKSLSLSCSYYTRFVLRVFSRYNEIEMIENKRNRLD